MVYWINIDESSGLRMMVDTLNDARRMARDNLFVHGSKSSCTTRLPKKYGTRAIKGIPIYKTLTGKKEVGFVIGLDAYYWVVYDKKYGSVSYSIRKDGSINKY